MYNYRKLSILLVLLVSTVLHAQIALDGTVKMIKYAGLQPHLIQGVSALPATTEPLVRHVCLVAENIIAITIDEQSIILSNLKPYHEKSGDKMEMGSYHGQTKYLVRDGERIGYLAGRDNEWFRPFNDVAGEKLDPGFLENPGNFTISSEDDPDFSNPATPLHVYRKTYPIDRSHSALYQIYPLRHEIYLVMEQSLTPGSIYKIALANTPHLLGALTFYFSDRELRSEAIHVNMAGFAPGDRKTALLSVWMGEGGAVDYATGMDFSVVDVSDNNVYMTGKTNLKSSAINGVKSYSNTDIYELDFSSLNRPGKYKIFVDNIGCSFPFEIKPEIWDQTARLLMKGFLHQRSGIELGPPYTDYQRPRNMHPADGVKIHMCDPEKFFSDSFAGGGQTSVFERIQGSILKDTEVPQAWGGWMDAGDFDQRMSHLYSVRRMMYLYEMNPGYFDKMELMIPESANTIPDILDEGRWCLDLYKRTQGVYEKGGVSWWVESIEHPRGGESSWLNSLPTALVPPTPRASLCYAATAGHMALVTKSHNRQISDDYLRSALAAVEWTDANADAPDVFGRMPRPRYEALAYIQLYRNTGDQKWHDRFKETVKKIFPDNIVSDVSTGNVEVLLNYLLVKEYAVDASLKQQAEAAIINLADALLEGAAQNAYGILQQKNSDLNRMATLSGYVLPVVSAAWISGEQKYLDALVSTVQYTMGSNPMNRAYISGLGERFFYPYQIDWEANNMAIPAGIPTFGPINQTADRWGWTGVWAIEAIEGAGLHPKPLIDWPHAEKCFNQAWIAPTNEFTVRTPMGELLLLTGFLAQQTDKNAASGNMSERLKHMPAPPTPGSMTSADRNSNSTSKNKSPGTTTTRTRKGKDTPSPPAPAKPE